MAFLAFTRYTYLVRGVTELSVYEVVADPVLSVTATN